MPFTNVWYFTPEKNAIQVIPIKTDDTLCDVIKPLVHADILEIQVFQIDPHTRYVLWMDDVGAYKNEPYNRTAQKVLGRLHLNWGHGTGLTGWFVVSKEVLDPAWHNADAVTEEMWETHTREGWNYADMDVSDIRSWINDVNKHLVERHKNFVDMMRSLNKGEDPCVVSM